MPSLTLVEIGTCDEPGLESWSPFCVKAHRALKGLGLPYSRDIKRMPSEGKKDNPTGQFPSLRVDGRSVPDSTAILQELDRLTGGRLTAGLSPRARAEAWLYEELADTTLNGFLLAARWADEENWQRSRDAVLGGMPVLVRRVLGPRFRAKVVRMLVARDVWRAGPEACWQRLQDTLDQLDARSPESGFWMGETLSPADLGLFAQLQGLRTRITPRQRGWVEARPRLRAWLDRVDAATRGEQAPGVVHAA